VSATWISAINGTKRLNELVIPGTHDSASWDRDAVEEGWTSSFTWTQRKNFTEQLDAGVRVFDLRIGLGLRFTNSYTDDQIMMVHGVREVNDQNLDAVLHEIRQFLDTNSDEFVILMFQQQGKSGVDCADGVQRLVHKNFGSAIGRRFFSFNSKLATVWPTVRELRGRVMVMERLKSRVPGFCNVSAWLDNPTGASFDVNPNLAVFLQDNYKDVSKGWTRDAETNDKIKTLRNGIHTANREEDQAKLLQIHHSSYSNKRYEPWTTGEMINKKLRKGIPLVNLKRGFMMIDDADSRICKYYRDYNT
jgi:1-phosphatidylinositol phosphodiesterase